MVDKEKLKARARKYRLSLSVERKAELAVYRKNWRANNRDKMRSYGKKYYNSLPLEKKVKIWENLKKWTAANPEYQSMWVSRNLKRLAAKRAKRRCLINARVHPDANLSEIAKIYQQCAIVSVQTGIRHEVDHIIPIIHGGYHHEYNLQILPESVNRSKADKIDWEMDGFKSWRDVPAYLWPKLLYEQNKNT